MVAQSGLQKVGWKAAWMAYRWADQRVGCWVEPTAASKDMQWAGQWASKKVGPMAALKGGSWADQKASPRAESTADPRADYLGRWTAARSDESWEDSLVVWWDCPSADC